MHRPGKVSEAAGGGVIAPAQSSASGKPWATGTALAIRGGTVHRPPPRTMHAPPAPAATLPAPPAWVHELHTDDVDALAQAQSDWSLRYQQLSRGAFQGQVTHVQLPGLRLVQETANRAVHQRGAIGHGHCGFAMPLAPAGPAFFHAQRLDADAMMIGPSEDLDLCTPPGFGLLAVVVDRTLLEPLWLRMYQRPPSAWLHDAVVVPVQPAAAAAVRRVHRAAMARLLATPVLRQDERACLVLRDELLMEWIEAIPPQVDRAALPAARARRRVVERACEHMQATPDAPPSILAVCQAIGASPRKLAYCFRDVLGTTPLQYQRALRLNGVRRDLRRADDPRLGVQDVAAQWGFWHLGDFAADYRRQFGELPSQTLRRSRGA
jgi:AraC family ethanolamine operon transcriptional activator